MFLGVINIDFFGRNKHKAFQIYVYKNECLSVCLSFTIFENV